MGADTDQDEDFRLDRAADRIHVGRLHGSLGLRVGHAVVDLREIREDLLGTAHDEHRLTTPFGDDLLARLDLAYIHLDRCTRGLGLGTGQP
ncbi:hypothetical protein D3C76_1265840 [compost metagenome]